MNQSLDANHTDDVSPDGELLPGWAAVCLILTQPTTKDVFMIGWVSECVVCSQPALRVDLPASGTQTAKTWLVPFHAVRFVQRMSQESAIGYVAL